MFALAFLLAATAPDTVSLNDRLTAAASKIVRAQGVTGAAIGVVRDGKLIYTHAFGLRDVAKNEPVTAATDFEIGSVTKQFTAAAILQLKERGKLRLDDKLAKFLPSFPHANAITIRQLLNQVSGLPEYLSESDPVKAMSTPGSLAKIAAAARGPLNFTPGTKWQYSNTNYYVLGAVLERITGKSYEAYVREHLFAPAGMTHSAFVDDEARIPNMATPYWQGADDKGATAPAPLIRNGWAGGAGEIVSNLEDMAKWDTALQNGKIVSPADYALMSSSGVLADGRKTNYGMGLGIETIDGHQHVWHNGGSLGSLTENGFFPNDHVDIIVFENNVAGDPRGVEQSVFEAMFPDAVAAANAAAPGEDLALRPRVMHFLDETLRGTIAASEMTADFAKMATPETQKRIAASFEPFGAPTSVIYKGKRAAPGGITYYEYRVNFASRSATFVIGFDPKTNLLAGVGIR